MRYYILLFFCLISFQVAAQTCSSTSRCKEGCCNRFGNCGFGPDFCGTDCVSDCGRKSECNPGYGAKWAERDKCPLNVCCSKHGYCGTTKEFCGDKKINRKTCSKNYGNRHVIGYFEGWASNRPCNVFRPEQIPMNLYTHINFAFATIDPKTFKIMPGAESDIGLYKRLMLLKKRDPALQVFIAIGGWTFNDPGPTATTFSDIAASVPRQRVFIESLISFMATYGFDGVDLDWEYPVADDRSGREVDFANFPKFMSRLSDSLSGLKKGISITIPASYWYLQHFDLKALAKTVDFFNIMSYDLHGTWDKGNKWTGAFLNGHTNLTEIDLALDLIWRNDIDPGQIVLGMGFYGRAFTVTSPACTEPGCTFESGGEPGPCSREVGILLNSEIDDLVKKHNVKPKLYKEEAVKVATWGDQWVQYDDEETFIMKSEFAQSRCLAGIMVWAISHDTKDAKYNKAIAKAANRQILQLPSTDGSDEAYEYKDIQNQQCKWTNCGQGCPRGWVHMRREDGAARKNEYMHDQTGCIGDTSQNFCCPTGDKLPTCGWYNHRNGKCNSKCPDGMGVIGGNSMYCNNGRWQAACCTMGVKPMKLYSLCSLGKEPLCDEQEGCPPESNRRQDTLVAASGSAMGGVFCIKENPGNSWVSHWPGGTNKYCCDSSNDKQKWSNCEWSDCRASCPSDKVRVALDTTKCNAGGRARCCTPSYFDTIELENPKLDEYREDVQRYLDNPTCDNPASIQDHGLSKRQSRGSPGQAKTMEMCISLITLAGTASMHEEMSRIWDRYIGGRWPNLKVVVLRRKAANLAEYLAQGPYQICHDITCSPYSWNNRLGDSPVLDCIEGYCSMDTGHPDEEYCDNVDGDMEIGDSLIRVQGANVSHVDVARGQPAPRFTISKRSRGYRNNLRQAGSSLTLFTALPSYRSLKAIPENDPIRDFIIDYRSFDDCGNLQLRNLYRVAPVDDVGGNGRNYVVEHPLDGQIPGRAMAAAAAGVLPSGGPAQSGPVPLEFFRWALRIPLSATDAPPIPGGLNPRLLFGRVMECVGSTRNNAGLVLVPHDLNAAKTSLMLLKDPVGRTRWTGLAQDVTKGTYVLLKLKATVATIVYLNRNSAPNVNGNLATIVNNIGAQLRYAQRVWNIQNPTNPVRVYEFWREWTHDFFETKLIEHTQVFIRDFTTELRKYWMFRSGDMAMEVMEVLRVIEETAEHLSIDTTHFN